MHKAWVGSSNLKNERCSGDQNGDARAYVLMTAAYNEELHIERAIESVLVQTLLPKRWIIVSDSSTDRTDEIVQDYAKKHDFIRFLRLSEPHERSFRSKVVALQRTSTLLENLAFDFIGNVDADVSVGHSYFEQLIAHFENLPALGLAAGFVYEETSGAFRSRRINRTESVCHAAQLVRRECYEAIGGYAALEYGGEDWYAQAAAKMKGWHVEAFPDLAIFHHRPTGSGGSLLRHRFRLGRLDYSFGSDPLFEIIKCLLYMRERPVLVSGILRITGFAWCYLHRDQRGVPPEVASFVRREQKERVLSLFRGANHTLDPKHSHDPNKPNF